MSLTRTPPSQPFPSVSNLTSNFRGSNKRPLPVRTSTPTLLKRTRHAEPKTPEISDSDLDIELSRVMDEEERKLIEVKVNLIDVSQETCIRNFLDSYGQDAIVKEYVDTLFELGKIPLIPSDDILEEQIKFETRITLPVELMKSLVNNFISALQIRYFYNQTKEATANAVTLFNPTMNFWMPQFALYPSSILENITKVKESFVIQIQDRAYVGSIFPFELLILRNYKLIKSYLETKLIGNNEMEKNIDHYMAIVILKCRMEMLKEYNIKNINWETRKGKVNHSEPAWRKQNSTGPPEARNNFYAEKIKKRIEEGNENTSGAETLSDYKSFIQSGKVRVIQARRKSAKPQQIQNQNQNQNQNLIIVQSSSGSSAINNNKIQKRPRKKAKKRIIQYHKTATTDQVNVQEADNALQSRALQKLF